MSTFEPEQIRIETEETENKDGQKTRKKTFQMDVEDIIAIFSGVVGLIFALGMVFGQIPVSKLTVGVVGFSGTGAAISQIIKAKNKNRSRGKSRG